MSEHANALAKQRSTTGADIVRAEVLSRTTLGHSKRRIARDLHDERTNERRSINGLAIN